MFSNAFSCMSSHVKWNLFSTDSSGRSGVHNCARLGIKLFKWCIDI